MEARAVGLILFLGVFGVMFIVAGIRRILPKKGAWITLESVFWGCVGIALGVGMFAAIVWFLVGGQPN